MFIMNLKLIKTRQLYVGLDQKLFDIIQMHTAEKNQRRETRKCYCRQDFILIRLWVYTVNAQSTPAAPKARAA